MNFSLYNKMVKAARNPMELARCIHSAAASVRGDRAA
jgi:hypothetical protein